MKREIPATVILRLATGKMVLVTPHWWDKFLAEQEIQNSLDSYTVSTSILSRRSSSTKHGKVESVYQA